ncbi:phosphocarrier protein HPr [candidate division KSB1 bacterium 4572_119]|nr:MAG: phosphocarrier protein HPr [candidate division KSB1 bacterium 4572_119]
MLEKKVTIKNSQGLHARPATQFVKVAAKFQSQIFLSRDGREADGKSLMNVIALAAPKGCELILKIDGVDEQKAMTSLVKLINNKFNIIETNDEKK